MRNHLQQYKSYHPAGKLGTEHTRDEQAIFHKRSLGVGLCRVVVSQRVVSKCHGREIQAHDRPQCNLFRH